MGKNRNKRSGFGSFLNSISVNESLKENTESRFVNIEIDKIKSNPGNFYGLRDIEKLADQIDLSHIVEPLIVIKNPDFESDGFEYLLLSGHRRKAAWSLLLEKGKVTDRSLPCVIHEYKPLVLKAEDGSEKVISAERLANMYLMFSNMGQREVRTVDERLEELNQLQPIARDIYDTLPVGNRGNFRTYFAKEFLSVSESYLQRLLALEKLTDRAKTYVDEGRVSFVFGAKLSALTPEEQESYLDDIDNNEKKGTIKELDKFKQEKKAEEQGEAGEDNEPSEVEEDGQESVIDDNTDDIQEPSEPAQEDIEEPANSDDDEDISEPAESEDNETLGDDIFEGKVKPVDSTSHDNDNNQALVIEVEDLPENINDMSFDGRKEAETWVIKSLEKARDFAKVQKDKYEEVDDIKCAQWSMRYGEALRQIAILRKNIK